MKVLRANGLSFRAIGRELGRDRETIAAECRKPEAVADIKAIQEELAGFFENLAKRLLTSITAKDIERINVYQRTLSAAVSVDKMRLLRDLSTENVALHSIVELAEQHRRRTNGSPQLGAGSGTADSTPRK